MAYTCDACSRSFGGLTGFDKHQTWTYSTRPTLVCNDPATMTRGNGSPLFKQDARGRWVLRTDRDHPHAMPELPGMWESADFEGGETEDSQPEPCPSEPVRDAPSRPPTPSSDPE